MADPQGPTAQWTPELERQYQAWKAQRDAAGPEDIPLNALKDVVRVPAEQIASIPTIMRAVSGNAPEMGQLAEGMVRHYADLAQHPIQNFYERPLATIMDVVAPLRGGAGVLKARGIPGAATADAMLGRVDPSAIVGRGIESAGRRAGNWLDRASVRLMSGALKPGSALDKKQPPSKTGPTPDIEKTARAARDTGLVLTPRKAQAYLDESKANVRQMKRDLREADAAGATVDMDQATKAGFGKINAQIRGSAGTPLAERHAANARVWEVRNDPSHRQPRMKARRIETTIEEPPNPIPPNKSLTSSTTEPAGLLTGEVAPPLSSEAMVLEQRGWRPGELTASGAHRTKRQMYKNVKGAFQTQGKESLTATADKAMAHNIATQLPENIQARDASISQRAPVNDAIRAAMPRITNRAAVPASALMGMLGGGLFNYMVGGNLTHGMLPGLMLGAGLGALNSPWGSSNLSQMAGRWSTQAPPLAAGIGGGLSTAGSAARVTEDAMREAVLANLNGSTEKPR